MKKIDETPLHYKNRDGSDTGYRPNKKEGRRTAADNPRVGNPSKEAGKGSHFRTDSLAKFIDGDIWKIMGPQARKLRNDILQGGGLLENGGDYLLIQCIRDEDEYVEVELNPKYCETCGLKMGPRFVSLLSVNSIMKKWNWIAFLADMKPSDLPEKLRDVGKCPGDLDKHTRKRIEEES